jgi:hypothetical protein
MRTLLFAALLFVSGYSFGQKDAPELNLTNAIVIGQMDNPADRYSIEINLTEMLASRGVKSMASLNLMKLGSDSQLLASDSISEQVKAKGFDTFILVSVRGYDKRFKPSETKEDFVTSLSRANLFELYQMDIVSVSFEFKFYRGGELVYSEIVRCGNAGSREKVIKKFRKKVGKRISKAWK